MAARRTSSVRVQRDSRSFTAVLSSAILEWLLIFLLFVDALFSYLVKKFARYCELQTPCLLCSRLDHFLGDEKPRFYRDLFCGTHKLEISSLVFCKIHDKLVNVHGMCESCLSSFATDEKSNSETHRLLVGKLGSDLEFYVNQDPLPKHPMLDSSSKRQCSCCKEPWTSKSYTQRLPQAKPIGSYVAELDNPFPGSAGRRNLNLSDGLKKRRVKPSGAMASFHVGKRGFDPLSHVGYTELKITSDSESEVPLSDDDDVSALVREKGDLKGKHSAQFIQPEPLIVNPDVLLTPSDSLAPLELIDDRASVLVSSLSVPHEQLDISATSSTSTIAIGHGLEELNWHHVELKSNPPALSELISLHDVPSSSNLVEVSVEMSRETYVSVTESGEACKSESGLATIEGYSLKEELVVEVSSDTIDVVGTSDIGQTSISESGAVCKKESGLTATTGSSLKTELVVEVSRQTSDLVETGDVGQKVNTERGEVCKKESGLTTTTGLGLKMDESLNDAGSLVSNLMDLSDAYKLAVGNKGSQVCNILTEQLNSKDSARVTEDLKSFLSQISSARGLEVSLNDMSPRVSGHGEESKMLDTSSSVGLDMLQKRITIERNESGFESLDGSIVSEIEGESVLDRLKRQVEYDRKFMSALYKELDEERNASAIAANQAMAMITRLQEEKATLHMEALQYLRMMEEQAEYDIEALQKANDLLAEREKDIQDLEAELEIYRKKFPDESMVEKMEELVCDVKEGDMRVECSDVSCIENNSNSPCNSDPIKNYDDSNKHGKPDVGNGDNHVNAVRDSELLDFEDERLYISQCLKKLEKKLDLFSNNGVYLDMSNGGYSGKEEHGVNGLDQSYFNEATEGNRQKEEDFEISEQKESSQSGGGPLSEKNRLLHYDGQDSYINGRATDLVSLENEVLDLNERLEALETDRNFLEHAIISLRNGDEGVNFIREIAHHLRELRNVGIRREQAVA